MTPDLMQEGEQRLASYQQREAALRTESGGRNASLARPVVAGEVDVTHGRILYLEAVDHMKNREVDLVVNLVSDKRTVRDSMSIRQTALLYGIPYTTTAAGARAMAQAIRELRGAGLTVKSL